jgi:hypothetical protein
MRQDAGAGRGNNRGENAVSARYTAAMSMLQTITVCRDFVEQPPFLGRMVRKGSSVRVRWRASSVFAGSSLGPDNHPTLAEIERRLADVERQLHAAVVGFDRRIAALAGAQ